MKLIITSFIATLILADTWVIHAQSHLLPFTGLGETSLMIVAVIPGIAHFILQATSSAQWYKAMSIVMGISSGVMFLTVLETLDKSNQLPQDMKGIIATYIGAMILGFVGQLCGGRYVVATKRKTTH